MVTFDQLMQTFMIALNNLCGSRDFAEVYDDVIEVY